MKHYNICHHLFLSLLLSFIGVHLLAQDPDAARVAMQNGNYDDARKIYSSLEVFSPGEYQNEIVLARECLSLQNRAKNKFKSEHFTEAERLYKQILTLNPSDHNAREQIKRCQESREKYLNAEFAKCKTVDDYRLFVQRYPESTQAETARRIVNETEQKQQDEENWNKAKQAETIESYRTYLSSAGPRASHKKEAYRNRARLYFAQAESSYLEASKRTNYILAKSDYEKAQGLLNRDDDIRYAICCAEQKYAALGNHPASSQLESYLSWAQDYAANEQILPHLRLKTVNAMLLDAYCNYGWFTYARTLVENKAGEISTRYFDPDATKEWTLSEWQKYLKKREKVYNKQKKQTIKRTKSSNKSYVVRSGTVDMPVRIPIILGVMGISNRYAQLGTGLTFGDYDNNFNLDLMVTSLSDGGYDNHVLFSIAPTYNIFRYSEMGYHLNVQPVIGYNSKYALMGGVRSGIGWKFFDFSIGASYANEFGFMTDFRLRMNINLIGRK